MKPRINKFQIGCSYFLCT